jgi:hypothetical protein
VGKPRTIQAVVHDAKGNVVPIESAEFVQGGNSTACDVDWSHLGARCFSGQRENGSLRVVAEGQTLSRDLTPELVTEDTCNGLQQVELSVSGPGCPAPGGVAIEGELIDAFGEPAEGTVTAQLFDVKKRCDVDGSHFRCDSLSPYAATYVLHAQVASSLREQEVRVEASSCRARRADGTIDLRLIECVVHKTPSPAALVYVTQLTANEVRVRIVAEDGQAADCEKFEEQLSSPEHFECRGLTPTGGGHYRVEVRVGAKLKSAETDVLDDGCEPRWQRLEFTFE